MSSFKSSSPSSVDLSSLTNPTHFRDEAPPKDSNEQSSAASIQNSDSIGIYGRQRELKQIRQVLDRVLSTGASEVLLVHGYSGVGKSTLVEGALRDKISMDCDGCFVGAKFDQFGGAATPYAAIVDVVTDLIDFIASQPDVETYKERLSRGLSLEEGNLLSVLIFNLHLLWVETSDEPTGDEGVKTLPDIDHIQDAVAVPKLMARLRLAFRKLVQALTSFTRPVVFFFDDLQWADIESFDLIRALVEDKQSKHCLFVGAFRSFKNRITTTKSSIKHAEDDALVHKLLLNWIEYVHANDEFIYLPITQLLVEEIDISSLNQLVAAKLRINDTNTTTKLTEIIFSKTHGCPYYSTRFVDMLHREGFLEYDDEEGRWTWDLKKIQLGTQVANNALEVVESKIFRLKPRPVTILCIASFLGCQFHGPQLVQIAMGWLEDDSVQAAREWNCEGDNICGSAPCPRMKGPDLKRTIEAILDISCRELLIEQGPDDMYVFSHDRVQQFFYGQLTELDNRRERLHLHIGRCLRKGLGEESTCTTVSHVVDHLNNGSALITDPHELEDLVRLNARAAKQARTKSANVLGAHYYKQGLRLVGERKWLRYYDLSLEMSQGLIEALFCSGNFGEVYRVVDDLQTHCTSIEQKLPAYLLMIEAMCMDDKDKGHVIDVAWDIMSTLGERARSNPFHTLLNFIRLRHRMSRLTDEQILSLPICNKATTRGAVKLLCLIGVLALASGADNSGINAILRAIQLSLEDGLCPFTTTAFAFFGSFLFTQGKVDSAFRYGRLALRLLEIFGCAGAEARPQATTFATAFLVHLRRPLSSMQDAFDRVVKTNRTFQDQIFVPICQLTEIEVDFVCGARLSQIDSKAHDLIELLQEYNFRGTIRYCSPVQQFSQNLMGESENIIELTGSVMNEAEILREMQERRLAKGLHSVLFYKLFASVLMGKHTVAFAMVGKLHELSAFWDSYFPRYLVCLLEGLTLLHRCKKKSKKRNRRRARRILDKMKRSADDGCPNWTPMMRLLEAVDLSMEDGCTGDDIVGWFNAAVEAASESNMRHLKAMSLERAGAALLQKGDKKRARSYIKRAIEEYVRWDATVKADAMEDEFGVLLKSRDQSDSTRVPSNV